MSSVGWVRFNTDPSEFQIYFKDNIEEIVTDYTADSPYECGANLACRLESLIPFRHVDAPPRSLCMTVGSRDCRQAQVHSVSAKVAAARWSWRHPHGFGGSADRDVACLVVDLLNDCTFARCCPRHVDVHPSHPTDTHLTQSHAGRTKTPGRWERNTSGTKGLLRVSILFTRFTSPTQSSRRHAPAPAASSVEDANQ